MVSFKLPMCISNPPWHLVFYTSFKVSTCLVVLVWYCHGALLSVFCFYYSLTVSLSGLFTCLFFSCTYPILIIKSRLWYKGTLNYLGESVTGSKFGLWKTWQGSCVVEENSWWGHWCRCRWIPVIPLHMHSAVPTEMGEQMILMSFGDVIIILLMHLGIGYKRKAHKSLGAVIWFSGTEQLGQLLGGHWPSTLAILVRASHGAGVYSSRTVGLVYSPACAQICLGHP